MTLNVQDHSPHIAIITLENQAKRNALSRSDLRDLGDYGCGCRTARTAVSS